MMADFIMGKYVPMIVIAKLTSHCKAWCFWNSQLMRNAPYFTKSMVLCQKELAFWIDARSCAGPLHHPTLSKCEITCALGLCWVWGNKIKQKKRRRKKPNNIIRMGEGEKEICRAWWCHVPGLGYFITHGFYISGPLHQGGLAKPPNPAGIATADAF